MAEGAEAIRDAIIQQAKEEASRIVAEAVKEKEKALSAAREEALRSSMDRLKQAEAEAEVRYREKLSTLSNELRRDFLSKREEIIDQVWRRAMEKLEAHVKTEGYKKDLDKLVLKAAREVDAETVVLDANQRDLKYLSENLARLNKMLKKGGVEKTLKVGRQIRCIGGLQACDAKRSIVVDLTYDGKIRRLRPTMRSRLALMIAEGIR